MGMTNNQQKSADILLADENRSCDMKNQSTFLGQQKISANI